jgi:hypothetical protein
MAILFAAGSIGFLLAPLPGFARTVGPEADGAVLFAGSLAFTFGSIVALRAAAGTRRARRSGWAAAVAQLAGALLFNLDTFEALRSGLDVDQERGLVWAPDAVGSVCFLVASALAWEQVRAERPRRSGRPRAVAVANLGGAVAFAAAAVASYVVPPTGALLDPAVAAALTSIGALGFLVAAILMLPEGAGGP